MLSSAIVELRRLLKFYRLNQRNGLLEGRFCRLKLRQSGVDELKYIAVHLVSATQEAATFCMSLDRR
jgi:hypothetical protein